MNARVLEKEFYYKGISVSRDSGELTRPMYDTQNLSGQVLMDASKLLYERMRMKYTDEEIMRYGIADIYYEQNVTYDEDYWSTMADVFKEMGFKTICK